MKPSFTVDPAALSDDERRPLAEHREGLTALAGARGSRTRKPLALLRLRVGDAAEDVLLPDGVARALAALPEAAPSSHAGGEDRPAARATRRRAARRARAGDELTRTEAADLLNVSRPHLIKLLDERALPHRQVGTHWRVRRSDVLAYRKRQYRAAKEAMQALADEAQEIGPGY